MWTYLTISYTSMHNCAAWKFTFLIRSSYTERSGSETIDFGSGEMYSYCMKTELRFR